METRKCSHLLILNEKNELFLYKDEHSRSPFWATAGGELKSGETYREAARRELYEETGLASEIGPMVMDRDDVYAVARSVPARWLEKYFEVRCHSQENVFAAAWTDEEKGTIQRWKWWTLKEITGGQNDFKPEFIADLLERLIEPQGGSERGL